MRVTSDLSDVVQRGPVPAGTYEAFVITKEDVKTKDRHNPMAVLTWKIQDGEHAQREIRFDNIILGGLNKDGVPITPFRLCNFLDATQTPWGCCNCNNGEMPRSFLIGQGAEIDGLVKGKYYCPDCKTENLHISYDTDTFLGARARIVVSTRKQEGRDVEVNNIDRYLPNG